MKRQHMKRRLAIVTLVALMVAASAYAFTAANTVPNTTAGDGSGTITGYTVSAVAYVLAAATPSNIDKVTFTIAPTAATSVQAKLVSGGTTYTSCTNVAGAVTCDFSPDVAVTTADQLRVIAAS
jgi:hypothetical protein